MKISNRHHARGFTLIEMMVALTIGLLISLVVATAYLNGLSSQQAQSDAAIAQESARFAFDLLAHSLRKAGYKNPHQNITGVGFCESSATPPVMPRLVLRNDPAAIDLNNATMAGSGTTISNFSDVIRVRYYGEGMTLSPFTADGSVLDCLGNAVAPNALVEDTLYVALDGTEPALYCFTSNPALPAGTLNPAVLIPGVESLQLLYGEDTDADGSINRYVSGAAIANVNNILSVMVSLITRTVGTNNAIDRTQQTINHFGRQYAPSDTAPAGDSGSIFRTPITSPPNTSDGRIRHHFNSTIALRNLCLV